MSFLSRQRRRQWIRSRLNRYKCVCVCCGAIYTYTSYLELCLCQIQTAHNTPTLDVVPDAYWGRVPVCLKNFSVDCNKIYRTPYISSSSHQVQSTVYIDKVLFGSFPVSPNPFPLWLPAFILVLFVSFMVFDQFQSTFQSLSDAHLIESNRNVSKGA